MTLGELELEIGLIVNDGTLKAHFKGWINLALLELAADFELPALKTIEPMPLTTDATHWLYDMPEDYHKNLFRCASTAMNTAQWTPVRVKGSTAEIDRLNADHSSTGLAVAAVGVTERKLGIYPMAADVLQLWYYKKPEVLVKAEDQVLCIPPEFQARVIIPKVVIKNFRILQDLMFTPPHQSLAWWQAEYKNGLYGSPQGDIGMINYFAKLRKPRRHGGRDALP